MTFLLSLRRYDSPRVIPVVSSLSSRTVPTYLYTIILPVTGKSHIRHVETLRPPLIWDKHDHGNQPVKIGSFFLGCLSAAPPTSSLATSYAAYIVYLFPRCCHCHRLVLFLDSPLPSSSFRLGVGSSHFSFDAIIVASID